MTRTVLEMKQIGKSFPGIRALDNVTISVDEGEVRGILGENGAGKSTLIKILSGACQADEGEIWLNGQKADYHEPVEARGMGIEAIYQEFNLIPQLNVAENIMLGQVPANALGKIDDRVLHQKAGTILEQLGTSLDTHQRVDSLNVAQQQIVEIAKALSRDMRILIMDEPTAALNSMEIERLFTLIEKLKSNGVAILYISHRLSEIFKITNSVTVLKDGHLVGTHPTQSLNREDLVRMMVGRELSDYYPAKDTTAQKVIFEARHLTLDSALQDVNFKIRSGEIVGITGLEGQGQRELVKTIFGVEPIDSGEFVIHGQSVKIQSPSQAKNHGIAMVPDDRKTEGLVLVRPSGENLALASLDDRTTSKFFIDKPKEEHFFQQMIEKLNIKLSGPSQIVNNLSGGNQQKVVVGKWLATNPSILVVAEPTRGVDIKSKSEIHHILREMARKGVGVLLISSELPEILGMSDRILVMSQGRIVSELPGENADEETIMEAATQEATTSDNSVSGGIKPKNTERLGLLKRIATIARRIRPAYYALILLVLIGAFSQSSFLSGRSIRNIIVSTTPLAVVTIGQTMTMLTGGIDLSIGSVVSLSNVIAASLMQQYPHHIVSIVLLCLALGVTIGLVNGWCISRFRLNPFIFTLAMGIMLQGITLEIMYQPGGLVTRGFRMLSRGTIGPIPYPLIIIAVLYILFAYLLKRTTFGLSIRAVGGNPASTYLAGLHNNRIITLVYSISGGLAALGGIIMAARIGSGDPLVGEPYSLDSITAAVLGGTSLFGGSGSLFGGLAGCMIIGVLGTLLNLNNVSTFFQWTIKGFILVAALALNLWLKGEKSK